MMIKKEFHEVSVDGAWGHKRLDIKIEGDPGLVLKINDVIEKETTKEFWKNIKES